MEMTTAEDLADLTIREMRELERKVVERARTHIPTFIRYVFGIKNMPFHNYMHEMADTHQRVTFDCAVEHGKTVHFSICKPLHVLGMDSFATIANVSSTPELPRRNLQVIRNHIETNERLHRVFPNLRLVENTKQTITVERKGSVVKDPSLSAMGIEGNILGRRWSHLITDDILRFATCWTSHMREVAWRRFTGEMLPRLIMRGRHIDIATPWTTDDARHKLRKLPGYLFLRFDAWSGNVYDINGKIVKQFPGGLWPELVVDPVTQKEYGWPRWRLEELKKNMPGHEFQRQIRCVSLSEAMEIFGQHVTRCMRIGEGIEMRVEDYGKTRIAWRDCDPAWKYVFTGVDLAVSKADTSDDTAMYTGALENAVKHPLELRRGKLEGPDIVRNMIQIVRRFPAHLGFLVETNGHAAYLNQFVSEPGLLEALGANAEEAARIRVAPHVTHGGNKHDPMLGIRSMSADFERGRWVIPTMDGQAVPLVQEWVDSLINFDPTQHPDDMLVAGWLFWEQCRGFTGHTDWDKFGMWVPA